MRCGRRASAGDGVGCGLKLGRSQLGDCRTLVGFSRRRRRLRIETCSARPTYCRCSASAGDGVGCGLKLTPRGPDDVATLASAGDGVGCGLKPELAGGLQLGTDASAGDGVGCGLKHVPHALCTAGVRASAGDGVGCGLKRSGDVGRRNAHGGFSRRRRRLRIETRCESPVVRRSEGLQPATAAAAD